MNERTGIEDLVDALAEKHAIPKKDAEDFVKEFFKLIEEALGSDQYVKIKGFGTFKLIKVESRESIDANTGERIQIEGHTKVTFSPEGLVRDLINKPFAHFETVALNDETLLGNTPVEEEIEEGEEAMAAGPPKAEESPLTNNTGKTPSPQKAGYFIPIAIAFVLLACSIFLYEAISGKCCLRKPGQKPIENKSVAATAAQDSIESKAMKVRKEIERGDTAKTFITGIRKNSDNLVIPDSTSYVIVGTMAAYKLRAGETLTKVSKHFYETKDLWPYIFEHNKDIIRNPNRIPAGITLRIPALRNK